MTAAETEREMGRIRSILKALYKRESFYGWSEATHETIIFYEDQLKKHENQYVMEHQ